MIFQGAEDEVYKAMPQKAGIAAHKRVESESDGLTWNVPVMSEEYGLFGVVDALDENLGRLLEYKNHVRGIYPGQRLQMQAQYVCLLEMGFLIHELFLCDITEGTMFAIPLPDGDAKKELKGLVEKVRLYNPGEKIIVNHNKCARCIYCTLCNKTDVENDF